MPQMRLPTIIATAAHLLLAGAPAAAEPGFLNAWITRYPTSTLPLRMQMAAGNACYLCHLDQFQEDGNCYRLDLRAKLQASLTIEQALVAVEAMDSDSDGVANLVEILWPRGGGSADVGYSPGLVGPLGQSPCGRTAMQTITAQPETPCYADCDASGGGQALNVNDFICFQSRFAAADPYANCDLSTAPPVLSVNDFVCFMGRFAGGCP